MTGWSRAKGAEGLPLQGASFARAFRTAGSTGWRALPSSVALHVRLRYKYVMCTLV